MVPYWCPGSATTESAVIPQTYPTSHTGNGPHWYPGSATTESVDISQTYPTLHTGNGPPLTPWFCNNWICSCWTCCFNLANSAAWGSRFTTGLFLIRLALSAYRSVLRVSSMLESAGLTQAIIRVWLLPPSESDEQNIQKWIVARPGKNVYFPASWAKFPSSRADFAPVQDSFHYVFLDFFPPQGSCTLR